MRAPVVSPSCKSLLVASAFLLAFAVAFVLGASRAIAGEACDGSMANASAADGA